MRGWLAAGAAGLLGAPLATLALARHRWPYRPRLERIEVRLPAGHEALAGLRIGFVTDTHVGPFIRGDDVRRACDLLAAARPDLLLLGGDYISESSRYADEAARALAPLAAAAPLGALAVLGNHDYSVGGARMQAALEAQGIRVLRNEAVAVTRGAGTVLVAGIDETLLGSPDPGGTLAQVPAGAAALALWHEPQFAEQAAAHGAFLQLSGHTHGGQVVLPVVGAVGLPIHGDRHVVGWSDAAGMPVYTSRGVGIYRPPLRFRCAPEVTLVTLIG
jgi:predicted MPP superfamily phosphohydrolase